MNIFSKNIFFPRGDELRSRLLQNIVSDKDQYVHILEESVKWLENVSAIKNEIIEELKEQIEWKDRTIEQHLSLISEIEISNGMLLKVLAELKEANNKKDIKIILESYDIKREQLPYFN